MPQGSGSDRRSFLRRLAGGVALAAAGPSALAGAGPEAGPRLRRRSALPRPADQAAPDEAFWELVKAQFAVNPGLVMMNAANLCPSPFPVIDAVTSLTHDVDGDASFQNRAKFGGLRDEALAALGEYLGADPGELVITRNTTEGNNLVVRGVELSPGDQVLLWDQNHPSNSQSWDVRARREGFEVVRVATPERPASTTELVAPFLAAATSRTRVLAFSHVSNTTGIALPAGELCAWAREREILTLVDGAQAFGAMRLQLHDLGCDFYTASSHKWFMGPKEAGILYVHAERIPELAPSIVGVGWNADADAMGRLGAMGQRDDAAVAAMGPATEFHERIGVEVVEARVRELATAIVRGVQERVPGAAFITPTEAALRHGVVIFNVAGVNARAGYQTLYEEHRIAGASSGGGIRLSPHIYNTLADVERAVEAVAALA